MASLLNETFTNHTEKFYDDPDTEMSIVPVCVIVGITIMYLIGTYWAWKKDASDNKKAGVTVIPQQSFHRCPQHYLLMFYTGAGRHSGTTANVFCRIHGKQRQTKPIVLRDPDREMFYPSSISSFLVTLNRSLDQIREIHLWHDISGPSPSWFLESVVISHLNTNVTWYFEANRWLDVSTGKGEVECKLQPLRRKKLLGYKTLFDAKLVNNLKNDHFWLSPFFAKKKAALTRFQKMSCGLAFFGFTTMTVTIFVRETQNAFSNNSIQLGPWKLTLDDIYRAAICSGVAFALRLLAEYLFLNTERKRTVTNRETDVQQHIQESFNKLGEIMFLNDDVANDGTQAGQEVRDCYTEHSDLEKIEHQEREAAADCADRHAHESTTNPDVIESFVQGLEDRQEETNGRKNHALEGGTEDSFDTCLNVSPSDIESITYILGNFPEKELIQRFYKSCDKRTCRDIEALEEKESSAIIDDVLDRDLICFPSDDNQNTGTSTDADASSGIKGTIKQEFIGTRTREKECKSNPKESISWIKATTNSGKISKLWKKLPLPQHLVDERSISRQNIKPAKFPRIALTIAQVQCVIISVISTAVVLKTGWYWPVALTTSWLVSLGLAFVNEIFVMETVYLFGRAIYFAFWCRRPIKEEDLMNELQTKVWVNEEQNVTYFVDDVDECNTDTVPRPPSPEDIETARLKAKKDRELEDVLKMLVFDTLFLGLLIFICSGNRDPSSYSVRVDLENHLNISKGFNEIENVEMFWTWFERDIIPNLYNRDKRPNGEDKSRFLSDGYSYLLGSAILRQQRLRPGETCTIPDVAKHLFPGCNSEHLTEGNQDTENYSQAWAKEAITTTNYSLPSPWMYSGDVESNTAYSIWGRTKKFSGGGYIAYLRSDKASALELLKSLQAHMWVDTLTRVVCVEFAIYNANVNILAALAFSLEFTAFGGALPRFDMYLFRLYRYFTPLQLMYLVCEIIFVVFVAQLIHRVGNQIFRDRWSYFKSFWNLTDVLLILSSLVAICLYAVRSNYLNNAIEAIRTDSNTFYGFLTVAYCDDMIAYISCIVVMIPVIQFLKFLKFNKNFKIFYSTLSRVRSDVCGFLFVFLVSLSCFSFWAHTMLKTVSEMYANFGGSFGEMISMLLGKFSFRLFSPGQAITAALGPIFTYTFTCANVFLILNIILTIITIGFKDAREDQRFQNSEYEILKFITDYVKSTLGLHPPYVPPAPTIMPQKEHKDFTYFQWKSCASYVTQNQYPRLINFTNDTYLEDFVDELEMVATFLSMRQPRRIYEEIYRREKECSDQIEYRSS